MSYERRGYGGRRRYRDDYDDRRREPVETPQDKLKSAIIKLGEVDPVEELPNIQTQIQSLQPPNLPSLSEAFHISVTEQPFKIPYYAALLRLLHHKTPEADPGPSLGQQILEEFWKGFQAYVDKLAWRETRFCVHFFAHLTVAGLVSVESFTALLQSFTAVLDEFGVSHGRGKRAALCAAEGLMIAGASIKAHSATSVPEIITAIQTFIETTANAKWIVQPMFKPYNQSADTEPADELLDSALVALKALEAADFDGPYPRPYLKDSPENTLDSEFTPFDLPSVLVTPEVIELDGLSNETEEESSAPVKKDEWPEYYPRLFGDDITPDPNTPAGYAVRTDLLAIIDIFEVNRKECARLLLEYPKWTKPGTFKPKPGAPPPQLDPDVVPKDWQIESTLLEIILGCSFILPESTHKQIYYISLITEVCKLAPGTGGPAVGKSIRRLFSMLSDGLDVEISRRFVEWFSTHMSNFNFQWVWKEWVPDLALCDKHPKRNFIRRALELEIRLSYYDRIVKSIPQEMHPPEARCLPAQAPGPNFEYDDPSKPHHDAAQSILNLFRGRAQAADVIAHLDTVKSNVENESSESGQVINPDTVMRSIAIQSLLHIGSRSFSHLLNAIERYLSLLRFIANGGTSEAPGAGVPEAKTDILNAVATFWRYDSLMVTIVFDKLMQYQIVDPTDVVKWVFTHVGAGTDSELSTASTLMAFEWNLLKGALDKANGRVTIARRKLAALRKEDDETKARANAAETGAMDVDDVKPVTETSGAENPALASALKALSILTGEQKNTLSHTLEGFTNCLFPSLGSVSSGAQGILTEKSWHNRTNWGREEWNFWETWGWYRHFCRTYSPYLRNYAATLSTVSFARLEGSKDPAAEMLQRIWNVAIGQE
ncbi:Nuclear cap-binding protein subunit 1 [Paramarasmius palmivorus]|uniref:Nuclear cap-binding protein subunit 1 n=1 Tax=Paramarasmius palmivorus TaxID=297713 RepID=A0AAW0DF01_9AGAR